MHSRERSFLRLIFFQLIIVLMIVVVSGCGQGEVEETKEFVRPVKYFEITPSNRSSSLEYSGKIKAAQEVYMAFEVPGKINYFPVREGQRVQKGELLAKLDPLEYQILLDSMRADLNAARADYERARDLYENDTISKRDLDVARRNYEVAKAGVGSAQKTFKDTWLVSPFSGIVAKTMVENFQNVQAKQSILILQDDSSLKMVVDIPERDYLKVNKNIPLADLTRIFKPEISVASFPDQRFRAVFKEIGTKADPATRTFESTVEFLPPPDLPILPGMTARLVITGALQTEAIDIVIPAKAVLSDADKEPLVWLIDPSSNQVTKQPVEIGEMSGKNIVITKGLESGDIIATSGVHQLREGMPVRKYENQ